jgi:hypothetical protein
MRRAVASSARAQAATNRSSVLTGSVLSVRLSMPATSGNAKRCARVRTRRTDLDCRCTAWPTIQVRSGNFRGQSAGWWTGREIPPSSVILKGTKSGPR